MSRQERQTEERRFGPEDCDQLLQILRTLLQVPERQMASLHVRPTSGGQSTVLLLPDGPQQAENEQRQAEERQFSREDCDQLLRLLTLLGVPEGQMASLLAQATSGVHSTVPLLPDGPEQAEVESSPSKLLAEQGGRQPPGFRTLSLTRQPRCRDPLPFPQQEEQSASTSVLAAAQEQSYDCQAVAMQGSCGAKLSMAPCWKGPVFSLDVSHFVNDSKMLGIYYDIWSSSSNGDTLNIHAQIHEYDTRPLKEVITVIDDCALTFQSLLAQPHWKT